jgi:hypothetical protein
MVTPGHGDFPHLCWFTAGWLGKFQTSGKILWPCLEFFFAILKWMKIVFRGNPYDCWKKRHIFPGVGVFFSPKTNPLDPSQKRMDSGDVPMGNI